MRTYCQGDLFQITTDKYEVGQVIAIASPDTLGRVTRTTYDEHGQKRSETFGHGTANASTTRENSRIIRQSQGQ